MTISTSDRIISAALQTFGSNGPESPKFDVRDTLAREDIVDAIKKLPAAYSDAEKAAAIEVVKSWSPEECWQQRYRAAQGAVA